MENIEKEVKLKERSINSNGNNFDSDFYRYDKETLYLKLKDLERKYEMLTS